VRCGTSSQRTGVACLHGSPEKIQLRELPRGMTAAAAMGMPRILVVESDLCTRAGLVCHLSRPQREIAIAVDGADALSIASRFHPNLVVAEAAMPRFGLGPFIAALRARRETAHAVVIVLTPADTASTGVDALRSGAVDFLRKPVDKDELELRVQNALHYSARAQRPVDAAPGDGFAGSLAHMSIASLLNMFALDHKSGELHVVHGSDEASVLVRDGAVISASFEHPLGLRGAACVYALLRWRSGRFAFVHRTVRGKDELRLSTTALLLEAARLADEGNQGNAPGETMSGVRIVQNDSPRCA
jgi:CheY-like chemotaxis protein